ncbi:M23 family metallopeptidase [Cytobacillus sp. IB215316]|uniref:M23 family metallopeptidase n=1 Tax=Cytobacillus sp. IB215316 TaxID=3097354 RepID=UPI002A0EFCB4|nr:peptidoglycan DD-metalloendopeptidase family protein [Cytobacillus sp. IB215316]MDX8359786.1 peptidoglycan DD-metalloendopeptidase family protein [Cytobacillus sp. IB215316]
MLDFFRRLFVVLMIAFCIGLLFVGGRIAKAEGLSIEELTKNWVWPAEGELTDNFTARNGRHKGLDISGQSGSPIMAAASGTVLKSYYSNTYGNVVFIKHNNGIETVYAHMKNRYVVEGEEVKTGQQIGELGSTGRSTGPHLHFEVHVGEWNYAKTNAIDPLSVLKSPQQQNKRLSNEAIASNYKRLITEMEFNNEIIEWQTIVVENGELSSEIIIGNQLLNYEDVPKPDKKITVKVEENDSLWKIALEHEVAINSIKQWNNLQSDIIHVGQEIVLYPNSEEVYIVKEGDSLPAIAAKLNVTVDEIKKSNQLTKDVIYPSQVLVVSGR